MAFAGWRESGARTETKSERSQDSDPINRESPTPFSTSAPKIAANPVIDTGSISVPIATSAGQMSYRPPLY